MEGFDDSYIKEIFGLDSICACYINTGVPDSTENMKKEKILKEHKIWYAEKEGYWYCNIPNEKGVLVNRKRKKKEDIEKLLTDTYIRMEKEQQENDENKTLKELFYEFMEHKKKMVKSGTIKRMIADWERFYIPHSDFIQKPFRKLTKIDIDTFFNDVVNEHTLKDKAFHNMCGILKQTLEYAVDAEYIEKSPYRVNVNKKKIVHSRKNESRHEVYSKEEQKQLIEEMERRLKNNPSNTAPLAILLDFELGTRKGETLAICNSDIVNGRIHICKQVVEEFNVNELDNIKSIGFKVVEYTKSEDGDRWLPLTERARKIIARIKRINMENGESYKNFLFVRNGYLMSPDAIDAQIKRGCEYIGIPVKTMHKIRKTYGSKLFNNGVDLSIVKDMLGHADETTTLKYYIYSNSNEKEREEKVLNALQGNTTYSEKTAENVRQREINIIQFPANKKRKTSNI